MESIESTFEIDANYAKQICSSKYYDKLYEKEEMEKEYQEIDSSRKFMDLIAEKYQPYITICEIVDDLESYCNIIDYVLQLESCYITLSKKELFNNFHIYVENFIKNYGKNNLLQYQIRVFASAYCGFDLINMAFKTACTNYYLRNYCNKIEKAKSSKFKSYIKSLWRDDFDTMMKYHTIDILKYMKMNNIIAKNLHYDYQIRFYELNDLIKSFQN